MSVYIIFERIDDPRQEKVAAVKETRPDAETYQLLLQRMRATIYNEARLDAFNEGRAFSERKTSADYSHRFRIEEVK